MKTMKIEDSTPRALREVREWKETVQRDLVGLTTVEALKRMHTEAESICREYNLNRAAPDGMNLRVAEEGAEYAHKDGETGPANVEPDG